MKRRRRLDFSRRIEESAMRRHLRRYRIEPPLDTLLPESQQLPLMLRPSLPLRDLVVFGRATPDPFVVEPKRLVRLDLVLEVLLEVLQHDEARNVARHAIPAPKLQKFVLARLRLGGELLYAFGGPRCREQRAVANLDASRKALPRSQPANGHGLCRTLVARRDHYVRQPLVPGTEQPQRVALVAKKQCRHP